MIVEHEWVTTLSEADAFDAAEVVLQTAYFSTLEREPGRIVLARGTQKPRGGSVANLPQRVRLDYDRGRVQAAVSVTTPSKPQRVHERMGLQLIESIEGVLLGEQTLDEAAAKLQSMDEALSAQNKEIGSRRNARQEPKKSQKGAIIALVVVLSLLFAWIVYVSVFWQW